MKIVNQTKKIVIAEQAKKADTFKSRLIGLLNRKDFSPEEALIITRCNSIHMFFMRFSIDVVFADSQDRVVGLVKNIPPFALSRIFFKASYAVELFPGTIEKKKIEKGDILVFEE